VQDRDGAEALLQEARRTFPFVERIIGDAGYQGRKMEAAVARTGTWTLQIVRRCDRHSFVVLPKRWIVERTLALILSLSKEDQPKQEAGTGLRATHSQGGGFRPPRHDPPHAQADRTNPLIRKPNFPDGL